MANKFTVYCSTWNFIGKKVVKSMSKMTDYERGWRDCYKEFVKVAKLFNEQRVKLSKPSDLYNVAKDPASVRTQSRAQRKRSNGEEQRV